MPTFSLCFLGQMGTHHDRASLKRCDSHQDQYNFGYRDPEAEFRTIMAYSCRTDQCDNLPSGRCVRIQRFSNRITDYNSKPLGDAANDNARIINQNSPLIAKYSPAMDCSADTECDDGKASTIDTCNVEKRICVFTQVTDATESLAKDEGNDTVLHTSNNPTNSPAAQASTGSPVTGPSAVPLAATSAYPISMPSSVAMVPSSTPTSPPSSRASGSQGASPTTTPVMAPMGAAGIDSFVLVYAPTNTELLELKNGDVIDIGTLEGVTDVAFNVRANPSSGIGVVFFPQTGKREQTPPLSFCGDNSGNYNVCADITAGMNTIMVTPIDAVSNLELTTISISFEIVGSPSP